MNKATERANRKVTKLQRGIEKATTQMIEEQDAAKSDRERRAGKLMEILEPCLKKASREAHWETERYNTIWGSKSFIGMVAVICRVMYGDD